MTLDSTLTWQTQVKNSRNKLLAAASNSANLIYRKDLSYSNKSLIFKQIITPASIYAAPIWAGTAKTNLNKIIGAYNSVARRIRNGNRFISNVTIRKDLNIKPLRVIIKKIAKKFYANLNSLPNVIIGEFPDYDYSKPKNRKRPRAVLCIDD